MTVIVHGHGEHAGRYRHVAQHLTQRGIAAAAYDQRGHGFSGGPRGHTPAYEVFLDDLDRVIADAQVRHDQTLPLFIYGHSFGGQVVLWHWLERRPAVAGLVLSAPWIRLKYRPPRWKVLLAHAVAGLWPGLTLSTGLSGEARLSHDQAFLDSRPNLDRCHDVASARFASQALGVSRRLPDRFAEIDVPLLILHGEDDRAMDVAGSEALAEGAAGETSLRLYPGMYHEVHNEVGREAVLEDVADWILAQSSTVGPIDPPPGPS